MFDLDKWQEIYFSLKKHKLRTALTAFGVFWGIFMLIILLGVGNGLRNEAMSNFGGNTNTIYIWVASRTQLAYKGFDQGRWISLTWSDLLALRQQLQDAELVLEINELGGWASAQYVVHDKNSDSFITRGTHQEVADIRSYEPIMGRFINKLDYAEKRKVAVIGQKVYQSLFEEGENPIGESIKIGDIHFTVVGVFEPRALGDQAMRDAEMILIPNSTLRYTYNQVRWVGHFRIIPKSGVPAVQVEQQAINILRERHFVHPEDKGVFGSYNTEVTYQQVNGLFTGITAFSWFVACGTILAGVVGVGNIMLIIVKERTREIGLRKALGATALSIISMVVLEAITITALAGYLGLVFGVFLLEVIKHFAQNIDETGFISMAEIDFSTALIAIAVLILSGLVASLLPASKAAKVNPIVALQDE